MIFQDFHKKETTVSVLNITLTDQAHPLFRVLRHFTKEVSDLDVGILELYNG